MGSCLREVKVHEGPSGGEQRTTRGLRRRWRKGSRLRLVQVLERPSEGEQRTIARQSTGSRRRKGSCLPERPELREVKVPERPGRTGQRRRRSNKTIDKELR